MFANVRANCWREIDKRSLTMEDMEDLGENSPNFQSNSRLNTRRCCNKTVFWLVDVFGEIRSKHLQPEILKVLEFLTG